MIDIRNLVQGKQLFNLRLFLGDCKPENSKRRFNTIPKVLKSFLSQHQTWNFQIGSKCCANNQSSKSFHPVIPNLLGLNIHQYVHLGFVGRFRSLLNQS